MLPTIKTIVYASDITTGSRPAFRMAIEQAVKHDARIIFLHAIEPMDTDTSDMVRDYLLSQAQLKHTRQLLDQYRSKIEKRISDFLRSEIPDGTHLKQAPEIEVATGRPDEVIVNIAQQQQADMIVMGDRGGSAASRLFLGSTTQKVMQQTRIPVLIVPLGG
ncbi:universal stress protein [Halomonas organivorans]|uniref:Nucleotide-binding universal stress UspA family protein n=1 Tax=Halomonas organivorans TaxID=257772 RepID=A0A7W5BYL4_9GAMM|nr:universal stress protein [Halomonas organivorans]MBB3141451.1 nucleotide-binding universal stress UspA family protein [Halomonas organivorans]